MTTSATSIAPDYVAPTDHAAFAQAAYLKASFYVESMAGLRNEIEVLKKTISDITELCDKWQSLAEGWEELYQRVRA